MQDSEQAGGCAKEQVDLLVLLDHGALPRPELAFSLHEVVLCVTPSHIEPTRGYRVVTLLDHASVLRSWRPLPVDTC